ncbi:MAG: TonB-dependent receptor domain-containing protein [Steroidobacteraceae bacterium]
MFGRNTIGGAIVLETNSPDLQRAYGSATLTFGRFNRREYTVTGNLPLSDTFGVRVAATRQVSDGYVDAILTGKELGDENTDAARIEALWKPKDQFNLLWEVDSFADHSDGPPTVFGGINAAAQFPEFASYAAGCPGATPATPVPETRTIDPRCANNAYLSLGPYATDQNGPERSDTHVWGTHLTATWQLDPSFTVKSITAYRETQPDSIRDADNTPLIILETINRDDMKQFTQELRFQGTSLQDRMNWQAGAFYFHETDPQYNPAYLPLPAPDVTNSANTDAWIKNVSYAFYTQGTYKVTQELQFTAGVRYTADIKDATPYITAQPPLTYSGTGSSFYADQITGGNPVFLVPYPGVNPYDAPVVQGYETNYPTSDYVCLGGPVAVAVAHGIGGNCVGSSQYLYAPVLNRLRDHKMTPMASLQYSWTQQLMTYLSDSIGYKSGGFNTRIIQPVFTADDPTGRQLLPGFGPETVYSYETGAKLNTERMQLDGAVFFASYQDMQLEVRDGAAPVLENAGGADQ